VENDCRCDFCGRDFCPDIHRAGDAAMTHQLLQNVSVTVVRDGQVSQKPGIIIARTYEQHPRYDVMFEDGSTIRNVTREEMMQ